MTTVANLDGALVGEWKNTGQDGMDALLKSLGLGWAKRKVASAISYGVGKHTLKIAADASAGTVTVVAAGQKTFSNVFVLKEGPQTVDSADGKVEATPQVGADGSFVVRTIMMGTPVQISRRVLPDGTLEMTIVNGDVVAKRIFTRC